MCPILTPTNNNNNNNNNNNTTTIQSIPTNSLYNTTTTPQTINSNNMMMNNNHTSPNHQLIRFNVGGKIFYTTRETIMNSYHHSAIYYPKVSCGTNNSLNDSMMFPGNCCPFSQKIRSPSSRSYHYSSQQLSSNLGRSNAPSSGSSGGDLDPSAVNASSSSMYNSLSTFVDMHNRKHRMSTADSTNAPSLVDPHHSTSAHSRNNSLSSSSRPASTTSIPNFENYFTRLLDDNQHLGIIRDENGCFFIDRNPKYFAIILEYLKSGELNLFDSAEYRSSELDTPEHGFHDLQLFAQKIIREADYFMIDISDQLFNIVGDQLYVSEFFQDRTNRSNQRCLIFFDKDSHRRPCSLYMSGIWFDHHIIDKECFVRNGVIEIYMEENTMAGTMLTNDSIMMMNPNAANNYNNSSSGSSSRARRNKQNNASNNQNSNSNMGQGNASDFDASDYYYYSETPINKRKSFNSDTFFSSLSNMVNNNMSHVASQTKHSLGGGSGTGGGPLRLHFVIHPQVDVKSNEKRSMMNFVGMDPSMLDCYIHQSSSSPSSSITTTTTTTTTTTVTSHPLPHEAHNTNTDIHGKSSTAADEFSSLFSTYGMLGASRRLSMEFPQLVENYLVVKDISSFRREFRLKEMDEPATPKAQFNKKYFNLSDYNHSVKLIRDDKDLEHVIVVETFTQIPEKFSEVFASMGTSPGSAIGSNENNRRVGSEIPLTISGSLDDSRGGGGGASGSGSGSSGSGSSTHHHHHGYATTGNFESDQYLEVASSDEDEFSVPQLASSKRKSINPNVLQKNKSGTVSRTMEQTKETRMRVIRNNFFAKSKREFLYIESKNRIYWASYSRGLITLELSNKNL
ncbi:hypothetical protein FDP41_010662 [Naegleria fowleri]|uniref:BTB domain-containing protein n=1 Tax=Naegleria fowleri TaxID=5763 RepID=A0A6A5C2I1_NAEFO|nr:uncharacterized protein FDP41_010662 [Naegleria fowleri]KAF0983597.1 hypothetical protein FDP41_010662 [Naegleria fowleri]